MPEPSGPPPTPPSGPSDDPPAEPSPAAPARRLGDYDEPRVPRGCHPLVFGVVMATIQFALTIYFMQRC